MQDSVGAARASVRFAARIVSPERRWEPSYTKDADPSDLPMRKLNRSNSLATTSTATPGTTSRTVGEDTYQCQASLDEWPVGESDSDSQDDDDENLELERMRNAFTLDEASPLKFLFCGDDDEDEDEAGWPAAQMTLPDCDANPPDVFRFSRLKVDNMTPFGAESSSSDGSSDSDTPTSWPISADNPEWPFEERPGEPLLPAGGPAGAALRRRMRQLTEKRDVSQVQM